MGERGFTDSEVKELRSVCRAPEFIAGCWRIRVRYERARRELSQRPSLDTKRYRALRRAFTQGWKPDRRPPLRSIDTAKLALIDPSLRVRDEPARSSRAAAAFRTLEQMDRPKRYPDFAVIVTAQRVRRLFEKHDLPFTDYDSVHGTRGAAARVLGVILPPPSPPRSKRSNGLPRQRDLRHLIRLALGKAR